MKTLYGKQFNNSSKINNNKKQSKNIFQKYEHNNGLANDNKEQIIYNQNQIFINKINKNDFLNFKNNNNNKPIKINKPITFPQKKRFNYMKNLNPAHMQFNGGVVGVMNIKKKDIYKNNFRNPENNILNIQNNSLNNKINENVPVRNSVSMSSNNINITKENSKKKMGLSQTNFYKHNNNLNYFPNIHYQRPNLNSISDNWMVYSHQQQFIYNDLMNNIIRNNPKNLRNDNFVQILDLEYKRPEEKLKKGQNQLILERLRKKYLTQVQTQNMHRTGTGFYSKNGNKDIGKNRQRSAQENIIDTFKEIVNNKNYNKPDNNNKDRDNKNNVINKEKTSIDASKNYKEKMFNKTYNGFNLKKKNKEKRKKEKIMLIKLMKYFNKKSNYFWVRYFNKKRKKYELEIKEEDYIKKNKSFDNKRLLLYPNLIKKTLRTNLIHKNNYSKKNELKYNTDNSEIDEIKEYKKYQKKFQNGSSDYANFIKGKKYNKDYDKIHSSSESENNSNISKKEPQFKGLFDDNQNNEIDNKKNNEENNNKKRFNYKTSSNFFNKNNASLNGNNNNRETKNSDNKTNTKDTEGKKYKDDFDKEKKNKFNIENIINNVIENNKRAAAARSSTSFYNIGSHFMNNHMRSTKTKFYNPKENRGGGFTGTKDSNFTKEQANEGKYYKPNSLKLTLINPINWRKHEEIWDNLVTLSLGLADLEKYLMPPNETDVLVSSYLKMNPRVLNFCSIQKINTSNTKNENNFISLMVDDNIQNPKQEIKKWKEAYKRVIFRWHPDKLFPVLDEIKLKNEQQKTELKKKSSIIINTTNTLYKNILEILNKILQAKNQNKNK